MSVVSDLNLPLIRQDANPEFRSAESCAHWLRQLPLINVGPSHTRLLTQLQELNAFELGSTERLAVLEQLREAALFLQGEQSKKFAGRAVPLAENERDAFSAVAAFWTALSQAYHHGFTTALPAQRALAAQRALWCTARRMAEHYKVYQQIPEEDWKRLHRLYALAEEHKILEVEVPHAAHKGRAATCMGTYVHALLLHLANPNEHSSRQMEWVSRWLERWAPKALVLASPPAETAVPTLRVDLRGGDGPSRHLADGLELRYIELGDIARSVKKRVGLLRKGESPGTLRLGDDVPAATAEQLLVLLHRQWCEDQQSRSQPRRSASATADVCWGIPAMHYFIGDAPLRQPGGALQSATMAQTEQIATFGRITTRTEQKPAAAPEWVRETWQIRDESLAGMRLERHDASAKGRFHLHQLIAIKPADGKLFLLATVRWLSVRSDSVLCVGVRTFPGMAKAIAVRSAGVNGATEKFVAALFLPGVAALQSHDSIILPSGWFRPKRVLEIQDDPARRVVLSAVLERGADYERVAIE